MRDGAMVVTCREPVRSPGAARPSSRTPNRSCDDAGFTSKVGEESCAMPNLDHPQFPHLFRPLNIKGVTLRNRIAISAHIAGWWVDQGLPSDAFVAYVE